MEFVVLKNHQIGGILSVKNHSMCAMLIIMPPVYDWWFLTQHKIGGYMADKQESQKQGKQPEKVDRDLWWRYVSRPIAIFISKHFLLKTPITANQLTIIGTIISIIGSFFVSLGGYIYPTVGCLIYQLSLVIDCADGTVARYRKTTGIFGMYVEELSHKIFPAFLMFGLAINSFRAFGDISVFYILGLTITLMYLSTVSRSSKTELLVWHIGVTRKLPTRFEMPKLGHNKRKNLFEKIVFFVIDLFNSPAQQQTLLLIAALLGYIHYALFFFFVFYGIIGVTKASIEYKIGFKIYGMKR